MISDEKSIECALEQIENGWKDWESREDGFMLYLDFAFATRELFDELQRAVHGARLKEGDMVREVMYGCSYGPFPRSIRIYYPLFHALYPIHKFQPCNEELWIQSARNRGEQFADEDEEDEDGYNKYVDIDGDESFEI